MKFAAKESSHMLRYCSKNKIVLSWKSTMHSMPEPELVMYEAAVSFLPPSFFACQYCCQEGYLVVFERVTCQQGEQLCWCLDLASQ